MITWQNKPVPAQQLPPRQGGPITEGPRVGAWMLTYTGRKFYPLDPRPEEAA